MDYNELYKIWHQNFLYECWHRKIDLLKYEELSNKGKTNFCCFLKGSRKVSAKQIAKYCNQLNIPANLIFFRQTPPPIPANACQTA